ncbi:hypothetical protein BU15DRAFT_72945 [Melanogaster broomeanus]|nr:hypothetical protein BU15DRAFT_72945 [Melanogaster broomeanus]
MAGKRGKLASTTDPEYETRIQLATVSAAAKADNVESVEKDKAETDRAAKKKVDDAARTHRIYQEVDNRVFDALFSTYKCKYDLITLAGALSLPIEGTVAELTR